jgi:hypothetical protein
MTRTYALQIHRKEEFTIWYTMEGDRRWGTLEEVYAGYQEWRTHRFLRAMSYVIHCRDATRSCVVQYPAEVLFGDE